MATSGSFNTSGFEGRYLTFTWTLQSQSTENNTSVIAWTLKGAGTASSSYYKAGNFKVVINGSTVYSSSTRINLYNGTQVASGTLTIAHDSNGNKTFTASAEAGIYYVAVNCRGSGSFSLPQINRYATITSVNNFTDEQNPVIYFTNPNNATLQFKIEAGGNVSLIERNNIANAQSPYTLQLTAAERNQLRALCPDSNTLAVRITVGTYNGGSVVNWSYLDRTMSIVNAAPTITGVSYKDTNTTTTGITGNNQIIVQNNSTVQFTFNTLTALKSATLRQIAITINAVTVTSTLTGTTAANTTVNFGVINSSSNLAARIVLTDSRGNTTTQNVNITIAAWSLPTAIITCARKNNYYSETDLNVNASYAPLNGGNAITIQYQTKEVDAANWGALTPLQDDTTTTINLDNTEAWNIRVIVSDLLGSTTYNLTVDRGIPIIYFDRVKRSVGINCFPTDNNSIESAGVVLDDKIYIGSQVLFDNYTMTTQGSEAVLGSYGTTLIDGLFAGVNIPNGYVRGYRLSAQVSTSNENYASVGINNIQSNGVRTWSANTMRGVVGTWIFKESDVTLEPTFGYTRDGMNLYLYNTGNTGNAIFYNVTIHGYLVKAATQTPTARIADEDISGGEPAN